MKFSKQYFLFETSAAVIIIFMIAVLNIRNVFISCTFFVDGLEIFYIIQQSHTYKYFERKWNVKFNELIVAWFPIWILHKKKYGLLKIFNLLIEILFPLLCVLFWVLFVSFIFLRENFFNMLGFAHSKQCVYFAQLHNPFIWIVAVQGEGLECFHRSGSNRYN